MPVYALSRTSSVAGTSDDPNYAYLSGAKAIPAGWVKGAKETLRFGHHIFFRDVP